MLRRVYNGWRFVSVLLALALLFMLLRATIPADILISILNGLFFGVLISIATAYGPILFRAFFGDGSYDRTFHYATSVVIQWVVMFLSRATSVWLRIIDEHTSFNDSAVVSTIAYLSIIAIVWQALVLTEGATHDRNVLIGCIAAGCGVAAVLVGLQAWGSGWIALLS